MKGSPRTGEAATPHRFGARARGLRCLVAAASSVLFLGTIGCGPEVDVSFDRVPGTSPSGTGSPPVITPGAQTREVTMRWLPSTSPGVFRYDLFVGTAPGAYEGIIRIPSALAFESPTGVYSFPVTLEAEVDYYMSLRAYDGQLLSAASNEIFLAALPSGGGTGGGAGTASTQSQPSSALASVPGGPGPVNGAAEPGATSTQVAGAPADASAPSSIPSDSTSAAAAASGLASIELGPDGGYLGSIAPRPLGTAGEITVSMWLRPDLDYAPRRVLFDVAPEAGSGAEHVRLALLDGEDLELTIRDAAGQLAYEAVFELAPAHDAWQHLAVVFDPGLDLEPRVYLDLGACTLLRSEWTGGVLGLPEAEGFVRVGGTATTGEPGFTGRLGHMAIWADALSRAALADIQARGHDVDLRAPVGAYDSVDALVHYWRLGDTGGPIGYDLGRSDAPIDLDDPAGGIDASDVVADGPTSLLETAAGL